MEPIGSISRPSKDPEVNIERWFNTARLEMFAANFESVPSLWHGQHIDFEGVDPRTPYYIRLLDSLGEPCAGQPRARVACAKSLCRVFCRLLRQKLRWAATKSLVDGTGEEKALQMLPYWAGKAERYMRYLPLIYLNTEAELKTKAAKAARTQSNKEKKAQEEKLRTQKPSNVTALYARGGLSKKKNTDKQQTRTNKPSTASDASRSKNKGSRPIPALVPLTAPKPKPPSQKGAGRRLMQRVVCGMRRAAKIYGLGRKAASVLATEIGNQEQEVHALWYSMRVLAKAKLEALLARGDSRAKSETAHLCCLDWAVADLMMMYEYSPVRESSFLEYKQQLALLATFHLVQRFALEESGRELPPQKWHEAARWYCKTGVVMSPVGLQRRWYEMKQATRRKLRAHLGGDKSSRIEPLHRAIANRYPHVVTGRLTPWSDLLAKDLVARPTNERGPTKKRPPFAGKDENTDKDNSETNALLGDEAEAGGEKKSLLSVRPGTSISITVIDNAPAQATSSSELSSDCPSEENSNHVHKNEVKNKHYENPRREGCQQNINRNKEIIDLDSPSGGSAELERRREIDDINAFNIDAEVLKEEDCKNNIDDNKEITDLVALSAESDELVSRQEMDDKNAFAIDTEVVKEEDCKNNIDNSKEITDLDAPSAEIEESERCQEMDDRNAFDIDTEVVTEEDYKNNIDDSKEITDLDAPIAESRNLEKHQRIDDRSAFNMDKEVDKEKNYKTNIDVSKQIIDLEAPGVESHELKQRQGIDSRNAVNIERKTKRGEYHKKNIDVNKGIIDLHAPSKASNKFKSRQKIDNRNTFNITEGRIASKANNTPSSDDFASQVIRAIEQELFYDRQINHSGPCSTEKISNHLHTNEVKNRDYENTTGEGYKKNIDVETEIIDLDVPSAESDEFKFRQRMDDRNAFNIVKKIVEGKIASKAKNAPKSDDFATQVIRAIEKDIFYNRSSKLSEYNECTSTQNCTSVSNSKIQPSSKEKKYDGVEIVTSSSQMNTNDSNSNVMNTTNKYPMLSQMLQTVCIFDDDAELTAFLNKNKEVSWKGNSSNTDVTTNTNVHEHEKKSLMEIRNRKRIRAKITDEWAEEIVTAIKRQRLESDKLENPHLYNEETSRDDKRDESHSSVSATIRDSNSSDSDDCKSVINLDSGDEVYKGSSDDEDISQDSEVAVDSIDPKLLMCPVVVMTRLENDPSLRIIPNPSPPSTRQSPPPSPSSIKLESPSLSNDKLEKLDACAGDTPFSVNTPKPEFLHEKTKALLKLCKPCVVLLERLEEVDKGLGRLAKRVELQDIDDVRRTNRRVLTAQVAPLAQDSDSSSTDSCDSDWTPEEDDTRKMTSNQNFDSSSDSDTGPLKPANTKNLKNSDDDLKQLLNDFVDSPADGECCRRTNKTEFRGDLKTTAALAMKRGCARCLWQLLSLPPASAEEAQVQRRLLRHTVLQATQSTAPVRPEIPKQTPSGKKQTPKQTPCRRNEKISIPATPASVDTHAATAKQNQRIPAAVADPLPEPGRIYAGLKVRMRQRGPSSLPKNPERRVNEPKVKPKVVADINKKVGKLVKDKSPAPASAPGGFDPIITSVLSLAPSQPDKIHKNPETVKLSQSKQAPAAPNVIKKLPIPNNTKQAKRVAIPSNTKPSPNYIAIPSNSAQPRFNTRQPHNVAQGQNFQSSQFERNPTQSINMSNALQPQTQHTPQYLPPVQTVVGQMGSQNIALSEIGNVMIHPNTLAGNFMPQGLQNAPWNNQGHCVVKQEASAFEPVLHIDGNQLNRMRINQTQPNPMYIQPNHPSPMSTQSNQPNPMYIQPNQPSPMHINQNQPNLMHVNQNQPNPMYIQSNQPNLMHVNQNKPNPMYIQSNQSNLMHANQNQPSSMYIQPNQPNPIYPNQMYINPNQANTMSFNQNQANPIYPNQMYVNPNQPNTMYINQNHPNPIYPNQMYINPNQPNPMHINQNQPNPLYTTPVHINTNQSNPMYIDQNQLSLINSNQNQPISICPSPVPIKMEPASSYLPPMSHPNPYGADPSYSPSVPMLEDSTPALSQTNTFSPMNAGSLQTVFNSLQDSQSFHRLPPSYDEAVAVLAGSQQESIQADNQAGPSHVRALQPSVAAVECKIGYCSASSELYIKLNSFARLKWYSESSAPAHEWAAGRDPAALAVMCTGAYRNPWALMGQFLLLSEEEMPPPNFDVWALNPRVRLRLPHEVGNQTSPDSDETPRGLKVKSFAKVGQSEAEVTQEWTAGGAPRRLAHSKVKLSDNPPVYAKLLVSVPSANACRILLKRGGTVQLYCIPTSQLYPIHVKPTGPDSQFSLSGESALLPVLRELARQLQGDDDM